MALSHLTLTQRSEQTLPTSPELHYEDLAGEAEFGLDPSHPLNAGIVDLELAPRGPDGRVHVRADVRMLRPLMSGGNRGLFLDVPNRGQSVWLRHTEPGPTGPTTQLTEGFLLRRGYTIVTCGWQHDAARGNGRFGLTAPLAVQDGRPLTGRVSSSVTVQSATDMLGPFDGSAPEQAYPAVHLSDPNATLIVRDDPSGPGRVLPRSSWRFTDATHVRLDGGFQAGKTYELAFTSHAPITGAGFGALRDILSFLRFAPASAGNPCAGTLDFAVAMGGSQTGRFLRHFMYGGFCEDEDGRLVLDGVLAIAAGARMTEANWRFGQPSTQGAKAAVFPFADTMQTDPVSGRTDGLLARALERSKVPKMFHMNTSSEYVSSAAVVHVSAAIAHLTADGSADAPVPANVRIYHW
ncbi:MAG: hypothetical protein JO247_11805, partial [Chloroflexi bacterium]|nr:hypothetical protein [Chloroflexota bacterium]